MYPRSSFASHLVRCKEQLGYVQEVLAVSFVLLVLAATAPTFFTALSIVSPAEATLFFL